MSAGNMRRPGSVPTPRGEPPPQGGVSLLDDRIPAGAQGLGQQSQFPVKPFAVGHPHGPGVGAGGDEGPCRGGLPEADPLLRQEAVYHRAGEALPVPEGVDGSQVSASRAAQSPSM